MVQKQKEEVQNEFLKKNPNTEYLYNMIANASVISGKFPSKQSNGSEKFYSLREKITEVQVDAAKSAITINAGELTIFVQENTHHQRQALFSGRLYTNVNLAKVSTADIGSRLISLGIILE